MKTFAALIQALDSTNKTNQKLESIRHFLTSADDNDKLWFLALFTGKRPKRTVSTTLLKVWALEITGIPEWLFQESYAAVGDLGETISLILPPAEGYIDYTLGEWMERIIDLEGRSDQEKALFVLQAWRNLPHQERFIFNKLLGGSFRVGVSSKGLINAIATYYGLDPNSVAHSIMGEWKVKDTNFELLVRGEYANTMLSKPYPFCLAYAIQNVEETIIQLANWQIEHKWDGVRGQVIKREGEIFIWSRGEELVTEQFPEIVEAFSYWEEDFVLDGEILGFSNGKLLSFTSLQRRLNRKVLTKKTLTEVPVSIFLYDILEYKRKDMRQEPLEIRRLILEDLFDRHHSEAVKLSPVLEGETLQDVAQLRDQAREIQAEGLMLKRKDSIYHTGRRKGDWWKWKTDPLTIDAVLIYAQKGSGRRSSQYTDYTFAVRDGDQLVTIAKAYSGLTNKEIQEVSRFVNKNAIEKFGPVRTVKPELVFEIAFEGIGWSSRHKAGVALRFPRILRWRRDKTVADIDDLETVKMLIT